MTNLDLLRVRNPDGSINRSMAIIAGLAAAAFVLWRLLGVGAHDSDLILSKISAEIVQDYNRELIELSSAALEAGKSETAAKISAPMVEEGGLAVEFENVSMAAPLLSFGPSEEVVVRFQYRLLALGQPVKTGKRYVRVVRSGLGSVRSIFDSGAISYYMAFIM